MMYLPTNSFTTVSITTGKLVLCGDILAQWPEDWHTPALSQSGHCEHVLVWGGFFSTCKHHTATWCKCVKCFVKSGRYFEVLLNIKLSGVSSASQMFSHPFDAPSNLSVSVSSIIRLLISKRIIAAAWECRSKQKLSKEARRYNRPLTVTNFGIIFLPSLTAQLPSVQLPRLLHSGPQREAAVILPDIFWLNM